MATKTHVSGLRLKYGVWDDLSFPSQAISLDGASSPPDVETDTGLFLFDADTIESFNILVQLPHRWEEGSNIIPHIHWRKTTEEAGTAFWSMRYKQFGLDEIPSNWSNIQTATDYSTIDSTKKHNIATFGEIGCVGNCISHFYLFQVGRLANHNKDTYGADALVYSFDVHYKSNSLGSEDEIFKDEN